MKPGQRRRILDRGGKPGHAQPGRKMAQPRKTQHQLIAALGFRQRVQFVQNDPPQPAEYPRRLGIAQHQRKAFGRGQQDLGRIDALAAALRGAGIAGAVLDPDRQVPDRRWAGPDCARYPPSTPSGARRKACGPTPCAPPRRCRSTRLGRNPASVLPPPVGAISRLSPQPPAAPADADAAASPAREPVLKQRAAGSQQCLKRGQPVGLGGGLVPADAADAREPHRHAGFVPG
jgi:hypothetical protein